MKADHAPAHAPGRRYVMSHMIADSEAELHAMAAAIGVARRWYQGDHYDVTQTKRAEAIRLGAVAVDRRTLARMAIARRKAQPFASARAALDAVDAVFPGAVLIGLRRRA